MDVLGGLNSPGRHEVIANERKLFVGPSTIRIKVVFCWPVCGSESWSTGQEGLTTCDDSTARAALAEKLANLSAVSQAAQSPLLSVFFRHRVPAEWPSNSLRTGKRNRTESKH